ncbi:endolytic transglycosylase MltG [Bacillus sp. B15-48]|uniref:endolytic transglycosylase MltG n=1 Tax=Bacillus sp. B15-48 TaxID=1548601 RepID=UPI00193FF10B|nr:endolytic transglycosylase MltG [Bacillus sp. B15-48]MBM4762382.1 endolytic transglycosylase MltG [Bacillus sp. B15-48]
MSQEKKKNRTLDKNEKRQLIYEKLVEQQKEAKVVRKIVFISAILLLLLIVSIGGGGYLFVSNALKPVDETNDEKVEVEIPIGSSASSIGQILEEHGIIRDAQIFKYYVKFKNEAGFMAGNYHMHPSMTIDEVISSLKTGTVLENAVMTMTIPEGKQLAQIAEIIAEKTERKHEDVLAKFNDQQFLNTLMERYPTILDEEIFNEDIRYPLEGYLFPATYPFYTEHPSVEEIVTAMLDKTTEVIAEYLPLAEEHGMTVHELLTMASLIEEEATKKVDRKKISSVFYNRMETGMPLQTDPTVLYAQGEHKSRVYYSDLKFESPYNTYLHKGLPPGPIANAGTMSIEAALNPEETDLFYFLATPEGNVLFSKTYDEHRRLVAEHITNQ